MYMQSTPQEMPGWMKHKLESRLPGEISITSYMQMTPSLWQKGKKSYKPLDESERGEWKSWLKTQHSKNKDHAIWSHHFMANRWGKVETVAGNAQWMQWGNDSCKVMDCKGIQRPRWIFSRQGRDGFQIPKCSQQTGENQASLHLTFWVFNMTFSLGIYHYWVLIRRQCPGIVLRLSKYKKI